MAVDLPDYWSQVQAIMSMNFVELQDTPGNYVGNDGQACVVDETNDQLIFDFPIPAFHAADHEVLGVDEMVVEGLAGELADEQKSNFLKLSDTPPAYAGHGEEFVKVNIAANALEFTPDVGGTFTILATANPVAAATVQFTDLEPGVWYRVLAKLLQNTANGGPYLRFNGDAAANYYWAGAGADTAGGGGFGGRAAMAQMSLSAGVACRFTYAMSYDFMFRTTQRGDDKVHVMGKTIVRDAVGSIRWLSFCGDWLGAANLTSIELFTGAGSYTGQIILMELNE